MMRLSSPNEVWHPTVMTTGSQGDSVLTLESSRKFLLLLFVWFGLDFRDWVSLHSPGGYGTHFVDQAGIEFAEVLLTLPPKCWN